MICGNDETFDAPEKCEVDGCGNVAVLRARKPHTRLCQECWEEQEEGWADAKAEQQRERRIFGEG